jgi:hypothetical protein
MGYNCDGDTLTDRRAAQEAKVARGGSPGLAPLKQQQALTGNGAKFKVEFSRIVLDDGCTALAGGTDVPR